MGTIDVKYNICRYDKLIKPDTYYDSHGVYSGSAFEHNGDLYYMYTGNHRDEQWNRYVYPSGCEGITGASNLVIAPLF
jgi:sucrose-6-phosphate hydrolase SacC (GH32 family)